MYYCFLITFCSSNYENMICYRHYREVEIPFRNSQCLSDQNESGNPGTSRDSAAFSRYVWCKYKDVFINEQGFYTFHGTMTFFFLSKWKLFYPLSSFSALALNYFTPWHSATHELDLNAKMDFVLRWINYTAYLTVFLSTWLDFHHEECIDLKNTINTAF
jgi:hypothetical protein